MILNMKEIVYFYSTGVLCMSSKYIDFKLLWDFKEVNCQKSMSDQVRLDSNSCSSIICWTDDSGSL